MSRVLVACEYSGRVRDAFIAQGHDALSCDLLPTDAPGPHYQGDVRDLLTEPWDLVIAHPECTYLCRAGQWCLNAPDDDRPGKLKGAPRFKAMWEAVEFFQLMLAANAPRVAVENPRPNSHVAPLIGKPSQVVQPWEHGHPERKATGLWLRNLPPLLPTDNVKSRMDTMTRAETNRVLYMSPGPNRRKARSATFPGIAAAMAAQWGPLL